MGNLSIILGVVVVTLLRRAQAQDLGISYAFPCTSRNQFLDSSSLTCTTCPQGSFPTSDTRSCQTCANADGTVVADLFGSPYPVVYSSSSRSSTGTCTCPSTNTSVVLQANIGGISNGLCIACPEGSAPDSSGTSCVLLPPLASNQSDVAYLSQALGVSSQLITTQATFAGLSAASTVVQSSAALESLLVSAARACYDSDDRVSCNALANLCVLQLYRRTAAACNLYSAILLRKQPSTGTTDATFVVRPTTEPLPWLYYGSLSSFYVSAGDVKTRVSFKTRLGIVASVHLLNGTWLGLQKISTQLQLCGGPAEEANNWLRFGWNYHNDCQLSVSDLLDQLSTGSQQLRFYDLYLQDGSTDRLYPLPVQVTNYRETTNVDSTPHVRRIFVLDDQLGRSVDGSLQVLQHATSISFQVLLRRGSNRIYPPRLTVSYDAHVVGTSGSAAGTTAASASSQLAAGFEATYENDGGRKKQFWQSWQTALIVVVLVLTIPPVYLNFERSRRTPVGENRDYLLLITSAMLIIDWGSFALCLVLAGFSIFLLIFFKGPDEVQLLLLRDRNLYNWQVTIALAATGQAIGAIAMIFHQTRYDIFFIDWEKPRRVLARGGGREEAAPVSCWRMLFVVNEWNELQTARQTRPALTLLTLLFVLLGFNHIGAADITPAGSDFKHYVHNEQSAILRFGITTSWLLVIGAAQLLLGIVYRRYVANPLTQFVDLLFLSNISAIVLDGGCKGFYLHGRNQAPFSDTDFAGLNDQLLHEEEGLVAQRGLVSGYQDPLIRHLNQNQRFTIYIPPHVRDAYEKKLLSRVLQHRERQQQSKGYAKALVKGPGKARSTMLQAQQEMTEIFRTLIDEVERNNSTQVKVATFLESVQQYPPEGASQKAMFVHDERDAWASLTFYGNELRLFTFEAILLLAIDYSLRNIAIAAFVTWLLSAVLEWVRSELGEDNISRKTLVDKHFLI